ncbi:MAG: hypothetical protein GY835_10725 [bacterium]|nr:hypothetical protein [bacterium]
MDIQFRLFTLVDQLSRDPGYIHTRRELYAKEGVLENISPIGTARVTIAQSKRYTQSSQHSLQTAQRFLTHPLIFTTEWIHSGYIQAPKTLEIAPRKLEINLAGGFATDIPDFREAWPGHLFGNAPAQVQPFPFLRRHKFPHGPFRIGSEKSSPFRHGRWAYANGLTLSDK